MTETDTEAIEYNLTVKDVSNLIPFTAKYIMNQAKNGELPHRRWGEGQKAPYLFNLEEVLAWKRRMLINPNQKKISINVVKSGTHAHKGKAATLKSRSKQAIKQSLANASSNS